MTAHQVADSLSDTGNFVADEKLGVDPFLVHFERHDPSDPKVSLAGDNIRTVPEYIGRTGHL
jgi:hypothetical protein